MKPHRRSQRDALEVVRHEMPGFGSSIEYDYRAYPLDDRAIVGAWTLAAVAIPLFAAFL